MLQTFFPYQLAVTAEAFSRHLVEVYQHDYGFSREEWRFLFLLAGEESLSSLDLARRSSMDRVQVSRAASRLEQKGLIRRTVSLQDRRLRIYSCTPKGRALFEEAYPRVAARAEAILGRLSPEERAALELGLNALLNAARADAVAATDADRDAAE
ncbi:MarR family transcriptional regulator [Pseudooceanicola sp. CBS1P-1]|uniref:MarR family transcriptional regulator n=1 Tax=Pseudooceanicola albus TaxID=2692189 RepID=A0A6L7G785_9RHOB|nr:MULTISPECIES: MarR family transcriptional regulator [Pseudooceanicola]MBT9384321.1 MarR family transcriptional regulator [Pseudooceanicola endophyticus]MXN19941.1 MarR family transcriptional regulator [Pseudooceanicola albus]